MKILNKLLCVFLCALLAFPSVAFAEEEDPPKIYNIKNNERAPFAGVLLNPTAAAKILADKSFYDKECDLRVKYEVDKEAAKLNTILKNQKVACESLENRYATIIKIKDEEIKRLSSIVIDKKDYSTLWLTGGVLAGIGLTLAVMYAVER
tara:strand:- start:669 stop:1118 length:450 start_codon:yes stop_codon:yes gene_type:complete